MENFVNSSNAHTFDQFEFTNNTVEFLKLATWWLWILKIFVVVKFANTLDEFSNIFSALVANILLNRIVDKAIYN